jgi:Fe2+ transport system protein B
MSASLAAELIKALVDFERKVEEIKKDVIRKGSSTLIEIGDREGKAITLLVEQLVEAVKDELMKQVIEEKKRIEEIKAIEKKSLMERLLELAKKNEDKAVEECFKEALRLLGL